MKFPYIGVYADMSGAGIVSLDYTTGSRLSCEVSGAFTVGIGADAIIRAIKPARSYASRPIAITNRAALVPHLRAVAQAIVNPLTDVADAFWAVQAGLQDGWLTLERAPELSKALAELAEGECELRCFALATAVDYLNRERPHRRNPLCCAARA